MYKDKKDGPFRTVFLFQNADDAKSNHQAKQKKKANLFKDITEDDIKRLKKEAKVYFTDKTEYFANIMELKYGRIKITSAQKRYGSCSSEGNICYSYRLMMYPPEVRDYVIVHELAHLKEMNHSKKFYDIIAAVLPDYKRRRRLLK
jgi:predicted metal-dependent hydrolase